MIVRGVGRYKDRWWVNRIFLIRVGREVPAFGRGSADGDCESEPPPRRPHRHCHLPAEVGVSIRRVCG